MKKNIEEEIREYLDSLKIIDAHEHLEPEKNRLSSPQDIFTLFSHYTKYDLFSAGMDWEEGNPESSFKGHTPIYNSLFDRTIPLEKRWEIFKPYWQRIRYGSYARAALLTAKLVYGIDDINDKTYRELSEAISRENKPGLYRRILCDMCNIQTVLTQYEEVINEPPLMSVMQTIKIYDVHTREDIEEVVRKYKFSSFPRILDNYIEEVREIHKRWKNEGVKGIKIKSEYNSKPNKKEAEKIYKEIIEGKLDDKDRNYSYELRNYLLHEIIEIATENDMVVAVHAGIWGDYRELDSKHMLSLVPIHPRTRFDLYHLGMPMIRDTIVIGKNYPNVVLNLCWTYIVSERQAASGIDEIIDEVPVNKVIAFGGDYRVPVEKVVGHLHMAKDVLTEVFSNKVKKGRMGIDDVRYILELWLYKNPVKWYKL